MLSLFHIHVQHMGTTWTLMISEGSRNKPIPHNELTGQSWQKAPLLRERPQNATFFIFNDDLLAVGYSLYVAYLDSPYLVNELTYAEQYEFPEFSGWQNKLSDTLWRILDSKGELMSYVCNPHPTLMGVELKGVRPIVTEDGAEMLEPTENMVLECDFDEIESMVQNCIGPHGIIISCERGLIQNSVSVSKFEMNYYIDHLNGLRLDRLAYPKAIRSLDSYLRTVLMKWLRYPTNDVLFYLGTYVVEEGEPSLLAYPVTRYRLSRERIRGGTSRQKRERREHVYLIDTMDSKHIIDVSFVRDPETDEIYDLRLTSDKNKFYHWLYHVYGQIEELRFIREDTRTTEFTLIVNPFWTRYTMCNRIAHQAADTFELAVTFFIAGMNAPMFIHDTFIYTRNEEQVEAELEEDEESGNVDHRSLYGKESGLLLLMTFARLQLEGFEGPVHVLRDIEFRHKDESYGHGLLHDATADRTVFFSNFRIAEIPGNKRKFQFPIHRIEEAIVDGETTQKALTQRLAKPLIPSYMRMLRCVETIAEAGDDIDELYETISEHWIEPDPDADPDASVEMLRWRLLMHI